MGSEMSIRDRGWDGGGDMKVYKNIKGRCLLAKVQGKQEKKKNFIKF